MHALAHVLARFPEEGSPVRRLYLKNAYFRSVCEDFALANASLRRFEARPDANLRPEIGEYREILDELERELRWFLETADVD